MHLFSAMTWIPTSWLANWGMVTSVYSVVYRLPIGRQQYVQLGMNKSLNQPSFTGVPQGSILGPLLLLVFYNDLTDFETSSRVLKYADDTVIYCSRKDVESTELTSRMIWI